MLNCNRMKTIAITQHHLICWALAFIFFFACSRSGPRPAPYSRGAKSKTSSTTDVTAKGGTSASSIINGGNTDGSVNTSDNLNTLGGDGKVEITSEQFAAIGDGLKTNFLKDISRQPLDPVSGNFDGVDASISSIFLSVKFTGLNIAPRTGKLDVTASLSDIHVNMERMHFGADIDIPFLGSQYLETDCEDATVYLGENSPALAKADVIPSVADNKMTVAVQNITTDLGGNPRVAGPASCSGLPLIKDLVAYAVNQALTSIVQGSEGLISDQIKNAMAPLEQQLNGLVIAKPNGIPNFPSSIEITDEKMIIHFSN